MKKGLVLCEGTDDIHFLGYFLFKNSKQKIVRQNKTSHQFISRYYNLDILNAKAISYYRNIENENRFALCAIGGKDHLQKTIQSLYENLLCKYIDEKESINEIVILLDRDDEKIEETLSYVRKCLSPFTCEEFHIENDQTSILYYENEVQERRSLLLRPVIIPFHENGSIESLLMDAVAEKGSHENMIVQKANAYIEEVLQSGCAKDYLLHRRFIQKAKFSSMISVINPDRSTSKLDEVLMLNNWNTSPLLGEHFNGILEMMLEDQRQHELVV